MTCQYLAAGQCTEANTTCPNADMECPYVIELEAEVERLKKRVESQTDWYQQRFDTLRVWVNNEVKHLSEEVAHRYFSICANGSPAPHENGEWKDTLHVLRFERDKWKKAAESQNKQWAAKCEEVTELKAEVERLKELVSQRDYDSPTNELERVRDLNDGLRARCKLAEAEVERLKAALNLTSAFMDAAVAHTWQQEREKIVAWLRVLSREPGWPFRSPGYYADCIALGEHWPEGGER